MNYAQEIITFFNSGGLFMYPLLICSIILVAAIVFRALNIRRSHILPEKLVDMINMCLAGEISLDTLREAVKHGRSPLGRLVHSALTDETASEEALRKLVEIKAREEFSGLQVGLSVIDMIVMIAPMFGILGTATGLVIVFSVFGMDDNQGEISRGIANALNTTIAGLSIATPGVIASVFFSRGLEQSAARMEVMVSELVTLRYAK